MSQTLTRERIAESIPAYVLLVHTPSDRITRRTFLSLEAAVKATKRAEARGQEASLELVRIAPYHSPRSN